MKEKLVRQFTAARLQALRAMPDTARGAALAELRRGIGRVPGEFPALWGSFLQTLPEELESRTGKPTPAEWAIYLALTLYALHQQSQAESVDREGVSLGSAVRKLVAPGEEPQDSSIYRRFSALVTSATIQEAANHLRGIIQLLRHAGVPLCYPALAEDLYLLQYPESASNVKLRWGQDFFKFPTEKQTGMTGKE